MTENEVLGLFDKYNALLEGHFRLSSGLHSEKYLQCALVLQHPDVAEKLSKELAGRFSKEKIDLVIGPAIGAVTLSYEVARALGARGIFAEREGGKMLRLRRGFSITKGEKALVVEDIITTGGSIKEIIEIVKSSGGEVMGVGSIIDRSQANNVDLGVRKECLAKLSIKTFDPEACPLCRAGIPIVKPGSRTSHEVPPRHPSEE